MMTEVIKASFSISAIVSGVILILTSLVGHWAKNWGESVENRMERVEANIQERSERLLVVEQYVKYSSEQLRKIDAKLDKIAESGRITR